MIRCFGGLIMAATAVTASLALAQSLKPDEVFSSVSVSVLADPGPLPGADDRTHLAYELLFTNTGADFVTLDKVEAIDAQQRTLSALAGPALTAMTLPRDRAAIPPYGSALVFMDTSFPAGDRVPETIAARVTLTRQGVGPDGKPAPYPTDAPVPATITFVGPAIPVASTPAVVVDPPLRGPHWMAMSGCCDQVSSHRGAVMAVNGVQRIGQRFAIDWLQLRSDGRLFVGDRAKLDSYAYLGAPVYAVADGVVVNRYDSAGEQTPGSSTGITPKDIGGNMLVIDIGGGHFAFFGHLTPGSLKVQLGDRVTRGQPIARLGNSGQSEAPHLHFQVMDGPSPINARGLPYVMSRFTVRGVLDEARLEAVFAEGAQAIVKSSAADGPHANQLPLNEEVVDLPD